MVVRAKISQPGFGSGLGARCGVFGLLAGAALGWFAGGAGVSPVSESRAEFQDAPFAARSAGRPPGVPAASASGSADGSLAFLSPHPQGGDRLVLIDTNGKSLAVYRIDPAVGSQGVLKLEAVRKYAYDLSLTEFNNMEPKVSDIQRILQANGSIPNRPQTPHTSP